MQKYIKIIYLYIKIIYLGIYILETKGWGAYLGKCSIVSIVIKTSYFSIHIGFSIHIESCGILCV